MILYPYVVAQAYTITTQSCFPVTLYYTTQLWLSHLLPSGITAIYPYSSATHTVVPNTDYKAMLLIARSFAGVAAHEL